MPAPCAPTPKPTKPSAKTTARRRNTHFARRRSRVKNIVSSSERERPLAEEARGGAGVRERLRRCSEARANRSLLSGTAPRVDEGEPNPLRGAAEDDRRGGFVPGQVRRPGERDDGEVGALAGDEGSDLVVETECLRRRKRSEFEGPIRPQGVGPFASGSGRVDR